MARRVSIAAILIAGLALRVRGLLTDFWLDEIWSLRIAEEAHSALGILAIRHDNNHLLNTLFLYALRHQSNFLVFRSLAFVCGIATVILMIVRQWSGPGAQRPDHREPMLLSPGPGAMRTPVLAIFASLSLPMVVYSTEARGYAPAALLAVVAFLYRDRKWLSAFAIALAIIAHATAVYVWLGLLASDLASWRRTSQEPRRVRPLWPHLVPAAVTSWIVFGFTRGEIIGGGPPGSSIGAALEAAAGTIGSGGVVAGICAVALLAWAAATSRDPWFFVVTIFIGPALALFEHRGEFVHPRYFFVCVPFALMLLADLVARLPRVAAVACLVAWIVGTAVQSAPFVQYGRGQYRAALHFIGGGDVSGDNDFRNATIIDFYARGRIRYHGEGDPQYARTPWFLIQAYSTYPRVSPELQTIGAHYRIAAVFPYGGQSGWTWLLYRRVDRAERSPQPGAERL